MKRPRGILKKNASALLILSKIINPFIVMLVGNFSFYFYLLPKDEFDFLPARYQMAILIGTLFTILIFNWFNLYKPWRGISIWQELRLVFLSWAVVILLLTLISFFTKTSQEFSRVWIFSWWVVSWILMTVFRLLIRLILNYFRTQGFNQRQIIIIGAGSLGRKISSRLQIAPWTGIDIIAYFDDDISKKGQLINNIPVNGKLSKVESFLEKNIVDQVWIALPIDEGGKISQIMRLISSYNAVEIRFIPDILDFKLLNFSVSEIVGLPVLNLTDSPMYGINEVSKKIEDLVVSIFALILLSPILCVLALGVKLSSRGPVFYKQERMSWNGSTFNMLKFRSMPINSEKDTGAKWANKDDNRATKFGGYLRRTSLDELPQLINVLKGDMSIVGPRPERPVFIKKFKKEIPDYMNKHLVKAGITGWAQANGWRGDTDLGTRIEYDLYYIENWSIFFDIKIMFMTLFGGMTGKNAY